MGWKRHACRFLVGKYEGKRPLWRHRCGWEDNAKIGLWEIRWGNEDWIHLDQDRDQWWAFVNTVLNVSLRTAYSNQNAELFGICCIFVCCLFENCLLYLLVSEAKIRNLFGNFTFVCVVYLKIDVLGAIYYTRPTLTL
jgi:hypothetical protein